MTRKSLYAVILAVVGLAFVLGGMAVDPASAKEKKRELHSVELLPVSPPNDVIECVDDSLPGTCESDGFGTAAVARDNNFDVTSWGATLQNLLRYRYYYLSVGPDDNYSCAEEHELEEGVSEVYGGAPMRTDEGGLASQNQLSDPTVKEGDFVHVCRCSGLDDKICEPEFRVLILHGDLTAGGKENVHRNNAKHK